METAGRASTNYTGYYIALAGSCSKFLNVCDVTWVDHPIDYHRLSDIDYQTNV